MKIQRKNLFLLFLAVCLFLAGCGKSDSPEFTTGKNAYSVVSTEETEPEDDIAVSTTAGLYVVIDIDTQWEVLTFMKVDNGKVVEHAYTGGTQFYNKYGDIMSIARLELGQVVTFQTSAKTDALTELHISDQAWEKDNVGKHTFNLDNYVASIGASNYAFDADTKFFSDEGLVTLNDIKAEDELRICGIDKKILSVVIVTGHGGISLTNTDIFDGGYVSLSGSKKYYYQIAGDMDISVPEGTYQLAVANNGYGGSIEIVVKRNEEIKVDLETLKGEGPKSCLISFTATIAEAQVFLDGQEIDITQPVAVPYGTHSLLAAADGCSAWSRQLVVNSESANIVIDIVKEAAEEDEEEETTGSESSVNGEIADTATTSASGNANTTTGTTTNGTTNTAGSSTTGSSTTGSSTTGNSTTGNSTTTGTNSEDDDPLSGKYSSSTSNSTDEATKAYLDTLSGIIDTLTGN